MHLLRPSDKKCTNPAAWAQNDGVSGRRIPRWVALVIWPAALGTVHVVVPLALSRRGRRRRGRANVLGVVPLGAGTAFVLSALAGHYRSAPDGGWHVNAGLEPEYLLTTGAYRYTRNPMYVGAVLIWSGWAVLLGSTPVAVGAATVTTGLQGAVAWEERQLRARFGDEWRTFAARTPRWLGRAG